MLKVLKFFGALLYGAVMYYLLWLFFHWLTPYVMCINWGLFIIYLFLAGGAISMFVASISYLMSIPLVFLCKNCKAARYAPIIFGLFGGFFSVRLPWLINMEYGVLQWILGISFTIIILIAFIALILVPFKVNEK